MKRIFSALLLFAFAIGCKKETQETERIDGAICVDGHIKWTGDPSYDGTGWVLIVDTEGTDLQRYILKDLSKTYQVDGLAVNACVYETDEEAGCFCAVQPHYYKISSIKKTN
jgi:hypothetical protein